MLRVLASDNEYLIALDIQVTLEGLDWIEVDTAVSNELERFLTPDQPAYDVIILDSDLIEAEHHRVINDQVDTSKTVLVYGTVEDMTSANQIKIGAAGTTYLTKPYTRKNLLAAFVAALEPVQPMKAREVTEAVGASAP